MFRQKSYLPQRNLIIKCVATRILYIHTYPYHINYHQNENFNNNKPAIFVKWLYAN